MSPDEGSATPADGADGKRVAPPRLSRAERRRLLDEVFGDVLPDQTGDETSPGHGRARERDERDRELRRDVPPHHGERDSGPAD